MPKPAREEETGAAPARLPGTPALIAIAAGAGLLIGGIPVLVVLAGRGGAQPAAAPQAASATTTETEEQRVRRLAAAGEPRAMLDLGRALFQGTWGARDVKAAEQWLGRAIDAGKGGRVSADASKVLAELRSFVRAQRFERESEAAEEHAPAHRPGETSAVPPDSPPADRHTARATEPAPRAPASTPGTTRTRAPEVAPAPEPEVAATPAPAAATEPPPRTPSPRAGAPAPAPPPAPAPEVAADTADDDGEAAGADTAAGPATDPAQLAAVERDLKKRVMAWFKAREPGALTCRDCDGRKEVPHRSCNGSSRATCPQCGGTASIQVVETVPGRSVTGVRTVRRKVDCPTCETGDVLCKCEDGKITCECAEEHGGAVAGYRDVSGRKAFWDFISPTARRGRDQTEFFPSVARGEVLEDFVGRALGVVEPEITGLTIERDRALVIANVIYVSQDGSRSEGVSRTTWIKEKGKFYLLTPQDTSPEKLRD